MENYIYDMIDLITATFGSGLAGIGVYLVIVNAITFVAFGIDKMKAKAGSWRISEKTLLGLSLVGGSLGGFLGMKSFRHKTKHKVFYMGIPAMMVLHIIILLYVTV